MQGNKPNGGRIRSESCGPTTDRDFREAGRTFSRPQSARAHSHPHQLPLSLQADPTLAYRQDIPVPQESLLRDVGLTVYTETPGGPGEPIQRSLSSPSPIHPHDFGQPAQERRPTLVQNSSISKHNSSRELQADEETDRKAKENLPQPRGEKNVRMYRTRSESGRSTRGQGQGSPRTPRLNREAVRSFEDDVFEERFVITEPLRYKNTATVTDKHLENLLIQEKANALPTVDLSKLYEVKSAKGIPENESMAQRAARILGISVPAEALGGGDGEEEDPPHNSVEDTKSVSVEMGIHSARGETKQVVVQCEEVKEPSPTVLEQETAEGKEMGSDTEPTERRWREKPDEVHSSLMNNGSLDQQQMPVLDVVSGNIPEFPRSKLTLSLPATPVEKLPTCGAEKRNRGAASKLIESLQDKLSSSASSSSTPSGRSATERMARLKERDSVSRIRRLSLKGSESGGETEERDGNQEEDGEKAVLRWDSTEGQQKEEEEERNSKDDAVLVCRAEKAHKKHNLRMDPKEVGKEVVSNEKEQRKGEHTEVVLHIDIEKQRLEECADQINVEEKTLEEKPLEEHAKVELQINVEEKILEEKTLEEHAEVELQIHVEQKTLEEHEETELQINLEEKILEEHAEVELQINVEEKILEEKALEEHAGIELQINVEQKKIEEKTLEKCIEVELQINVEDKTLEEHAKVELQIKVEEKTLEEKSLEEHAEVEPQINVEEKSLEEHAEVELQINEGELKNEIALGAAEEAEGKKDAVQSQSEEVAELRQTGEEEAEPRGRESGAGGTRPESGERGAAGPDQQAMRPKPRQRTSRPQKPPLLPKPRSVPKREITLPLSFSTVTSAMEDKEALSVSDSYDPSRVERV